MNPPCHRIDPLRSRREFLSRAGCGFGALAFGYLLGLDGFLARASNPKIDPLNPLSPRPPHRPAPAKSVIWLFMEGGPSHLDLFDPKPALDKLAGQPMPESFGKVITAMGTASNSLMPSKRSFKQYGQSGIWVSDWLPNIAQHADDMTVIRSCWADGLNHVGSVCQMNTGDILAGRPSLGAWTTYGLGTANDNLPTFVVMADGADPVGGPKNWSAGFLPATFEGTQFRTEGTPIFHLRPPRTIGEKQQRSKLDFLAELNRHFSADKPEDTELAARLNSYELAYRMQAAAPEAVDLSRESELTRKLYGLDEEPTRKFGTLCLLSRRLVERGVRFVQLYINSQIWDTHTNLEDGMRAASARTDKPVAALLQDLDRRGLLKDTLVVWGGEFGRMPIAQLGGNPRESGRDHNPRGFSLWMAGGGVKPGMTYGATDDLGYEAVENKVSVTDWHATILHLLGLDYEKLVFDQNGLKEKLTSVFEARVVKEILA